MPDARECPFCGSVMRRVVRELVQRIPGTGESRTTRTEEWVCADCDYFEEAERGAEERERRE